MKLPTKEDWISFLNFKKKTIINIIIHSKNYDKAVERSKKNIEQSVKYINDNIELSEKLNAIIEKN